MALPPCFRTAVLAGVVLSAAPARAYCVATTCDRATTSCGEDERGCKVEGKSVRWKAERVSLGVASGSILRGITAEEASEALADALSTWASVTCPAGAPDLSITSLGVLEDAAVGFVPRGSNQGVAAFYDEAFPGGGDTVARTLLGLDLGTGEILDADIILNAEGFALADGDGEAGDVDLVAVLTHEVGHVLGLDHSNVADATMQAETDGFGTDALRTLEPDDVEGLCALYPPDAPDAPDPGDEESPSGSGSGCAIGTSPRPGGGSGWAGWLGALAVLRRLGDRYGSSRQGSRRRG